MRPLCGACANGLHGTAVAPRECPGCHHAVFAQTVPRPDEGAHRPALMCPRCGGFISWKE